MPERRVAEVVGERDGFAKIFVQAHRARDGARELGHFQRVRHARPEKIAFVVQEDLGFVDEAPKCGAVDDAVAVTLEVVARGRGGFAVTAAARQRRIAGPWLERHGHAPRSTCVRIQDLGDQRVLGRMHTRPPWRLDHDKTDGSGAGLLVMPHQLQIA